MSQVRVLPGSPTTGLSDPEQGSPIGLPGAAHFGGDAWPQERRKQERPYGEFAIFAVADTLFPIHYCETGFERYCYIG